MAALHQRDDGIWVLPFGGAFVNRVCRMADSGIVLYLQWGEEPEATIRFSCDFEVTVPDQETYRLSTERLDGLAPILAMARSSVRQATFTLTGVLTVILEDGRRVEARNHPSYESWEVNGPGGIVVVAMPGQDEEPTIWR